MTTVVGIYSAYIDRAYARASVWPRVEIMKSSTLDSFYYSIFNAGTGPALIQQVKVTVDGKVVKSWHDIEGLPVFTQSQVSRRILPAQQTIKPLLYQGDKIADLLKLNDSLTITLCYCSIYDECWLTDRNNKSVEVEHCAIDEKDRFLQ
ncbi:hypothetical protein [Colwellia sp. MEBiC06753]